jgi:hypothetical protein
MRQYSLTGRKRSGQPETAEVRAKQVAVRSFSARAKDVRQPSNFLAAHVSA